MPYDDIIFKLAPGQVSDPMAIDRNSPGTGQSAIFMVSEKDSVRVIDTKQMEVLKSRVLFDWVLQQISQHVKHSYTAEDQAWVTEQLTKES